MPTIEEKEKILESKKEKKSRKLIFKKKIPTGIDLLDLALEGGWDVGGVSQIFSDSKAGKTLFAVELLYNAMIKYGGKKIKYRYNDAEAGLSFDTEERYGFPLLGSKHHVHIPIIESVKADILEFCDTVDPSKDEVGIYITDSQDQLYSLADKGRTDEQRKKYKKAGEANDIGTYGDRAKKLGELWRESTIPCYEHNVHALIISQIRDNLNAGLFGKKHIVSGGHSSKFTASKRFELTRVCDIGPKDRPYGYRVKVFLDKTRTKFEKRKVYVDIIIDRGFDNVRSNLLFVYDLLDEYGKDLLPKMAALKWNSTYDPYDTSETEGVSNEDYKTFCKEQKIEDTIKEEFQSLRVSNIKKYLSAHSDVMKTFVDQFEVMSFNDMITYIESNDLEEELTRRATLKWNYLENKDKPQNRKERKRVEL